MGLHINRYTKNDLQYALLWVLVLYLTNLNVLIYEEYWFNKIDRALGSLDYLEHSVAQGLPIEWSDYKDYGAGYKDVIFLDFEGSIFFHLSVLFVCVLYITRILLRQGLASTLKEGISLFSIDVLCWALYFYVFIYKIALEAPYCGAIPMVFVAPVLLSILIVLRVWQYSYCISPNKNVNAKENRGNSNVNRTR